MKFELLQRLRWKPEDASNGSHWDVFNIQARPSLEFASEHNTCTSSLQGVDGMWYAGSSVIFESVSAVMEYNELLLRQMED